LKLPRCLCFASMLLAGVTWSGSAAADLFSHVLLPGSNTSVSCTIVNLGKKPLEVTIEAINSNDGAVLASSALKTLAPGVGAAEQFDVGTGPQYCGFLGHFSTKSVRAAAGLTSVAGSNVVVIPVQ
jgi:hypothetical protein